KLDVADFFPSINKRTLCAITERAIRDPEIRWLNRVLLFHDPTTDYRFQSRRGHALGPEQAGYPVPNRKSLFGNDNQHGLPIGNLTSQFWGNVYLDQVDQFIKRKLRCRYYVRYVDDMMLLAESPDQLLRWREQIAIFLRDRLRLELKAGQRELISLREGVEYIGWKTWWNRRVPHRRTLGRLRTRLASFERVAATFHRFGIYGFTGPDTTVAGWVVSQYGLITAAITPDGPCGLDRPRPAARSAR
ncbi:MAG: RNA-directed DNA polymerase, partial [Candidatus Binatia bacterium]